ncbi:ABC transporter substrate-binding protein [Streptomyces capparidis]
MRAARPARLCLAALLVALAALTGGCGEPRERVTLIGPWTGGEEKAFRELLEPFERRHGIDVDYQGTTATREVLLAGVEASDPPHVAVLSGTGDLADFARRGKLRALRADAFDRSAYPDPWQARPRGDAKRYWVPVKADLKSIVWYRTDRGGDPADPPRDVRRWCLGMGTDSTIGWPATDWIEDVLLQRSGRDVYDRWATGRLPWTDEAVVDAWEKLGEFMSGGDGTEGPDSLVRDARGEEGGSGLLFSERSPCDLEHQGSFARGWYGDRARDADFRPSPELLPDRMLRDAAGKGPDRQVAADYAAVFRDDAAAHDLLEFLVETGTQRAWATDAAPAGFSANREVIAADYRDDPVGARVVEELRRSERLCLDASDVMPPTVRRAFHEKALEFLADPGQDPRPLLGRIQQAQQEELPPNTLWLEHACG